MARSAKQPSKRASAPAKRSRSGGALVLRLIARNPTLVGGTTGFLIALSFVSANALWYQPYAHKHAFFTTRSYPVQPVVDERPETTIHLERQETAPAAQVRPTGDPKVEQVQSVLKELRVYAGMVDGVAGPATRRAIEAYQAKMGLPVTGVVDDALLDHLGATPTTAGIVPPPLLRQAAKPSSEVANAAVHDDRVRKVQAGLKAFGNEAIDIDGVMGSRTKSALREFQSLFGLPETGNADVEVLAKMKEIGLIN